MPKLLRESKNLISRWKIILYPLLVQFRFLSRCAPITQANRRGEGNKIVCRIACFGMILAAVMKTISLTQLLSTCLDASGKGCKVTNLKKLTMLLMFLCRLCYSEYRLALLNFSRLSPHRLFEAFKKMELLKES